MIDNTDYQERVHLERAELAVRFHKLQSFTTSPAFDNLPALDQLLLRQQGNAMQQYLIILDRRIARFKPPSRTTPLHDNNTNV